MSWAALDQGGELLGGGGDLEQPRGERLVGSDLLGQTARPRLVGQQPDHLRVVAVLGLEGAAGQVGLVVVALGQQPRWMLGVQVDLEQPVIFSARICRRDCFQIRLEPAQRPAEPQPGAPAGWLGTQPGQVPTDGVNGLLDDDPRLRNRQRMSQEQRRRLLKAPPHSASLVRQALPRCSQVPDVPR